MNNGSCIYVRTWNDDPAHQHLSYERQLRDARRLAEKHSLQVPDHHLFSDIDYPGHLPPTCWAGEADECRPALSALIEAIEAGAIDRIIVGRMERLATDAVVLQQLHDLLRQRGVHLISEPHPLAAEEDPAEAFAAELLADCIQYDTDAEREQKAKLRARKIDEIDRLKARVDRLEAEVAELSDYLR
jgi:DNA invertase Pin-like site-specific DNA recombinase